MQPDGVKRTVYVYLFSVSHQFVLAYLSSLPVLSLLNTVSWNAITRNL